MPEPLNNDEAERRVITLIYAALNSFTVGILLGFIPVVLGSRRIALPLTLTLIFIQLLRWLAWRRYLKLVSSLAVATGCVFITVLLYSLGTIQTAGTSLYVLPIIASGLLIGRRAMIITTVVNTLLMLGLGIAEVLGVLPPPDLVVGVRMWVAYGIIYGLTAVFLHIAVRDMDTSLAQAKHEVKERRQAESLYRSLFESSPDGIVISNRSGILEMFNTAAVDLLGYERDEVIGKSVFSFLAPDELSGDPTNYRPGEDIVNAETTLIGKDGRQIFVICSMLGLPDGRFQYIFRDITKRKEAEEALLASQHKLQQYADIVNNIQIGLYVFHMDELDNHHSLRMIEANPAALRMSHKRYEDAIGQTIDEIFETLRDKGFPESYSEVVRTGTAANLTDVYYDQQGNLLGAFDVKVFPLPHQSIGVAFEDIRARVEAEIEQEKLVQELEAKNQELERFTYTVSHDLKSPLVTIRGFLGFIESDAHNGRIDRIFGDIARIQDAADKMHGLLNDLLEMSRVGRIINPPTPVAFSTLVEEALKLVSGQLQEREVQLQVQPHLPTVYGDRPRLVEVVQNLLDNAIKFMGEQPNPIIEVGAKPPDGNKAIFFVRDNGIGIKPEYQQKIFDLFDRLDPTVPGSGIGLTLVKRIVEVHKGNIWVESAGPGQGSVFYFELPLPE